eukprot:CAMPEP_0173369780 /NCGR_PEP_ID=MMETSP1144-20121109/26284_1 /TAXON_ID=483371 /ORGANISM="non described non described, Strain CCMP2298" /LENGTH=156 /DNA_ID=CAMNT_0014321185 /DNA_START=137 /DNA_END=605 /DNA_ORIENTATION=-
MASVTPLGRPHPAHSVASAACASAASASAASSAVPAEPAPVAHPLGFCLRSPEPPPMRLEPPEPCEPRDAPEPWLRLRLRLSRESGFSSMRRSLDPTMVLPKASTSLSRYILSRWRRVTVSATSSAAMQRSDVALQQLSAATHAGPSTESTRRPEA